MTRLAYTREGTFTRVLGEDLNYLMAIDEAAIAAVLAELESYGRSVVAMPSNADLAKHYDWLITRLSLDAIYVSQINGLEPAPGESDYIGTQARRTIRVWIRSILGAVDYGQFALMTHTRPEEIKLWSMNDEKFLAMR